MRPNRRRPSAPILVAAAAGAMLAAGAAQAVHCEQVTYRTWTQAGNTWFDHGETVTIAPGVETHLYIHFDTGSSGTPLRTSAQIGHPSDFGLRAPSGNAAFRRQAPKDAQDGRLIFDAQGPAEAMLGYRLTDIAKAGAFAGLADQCRSGTVSVRIGDGRAGHPTPGRHDERDQQRDSARDARVAAQQLTRRVHLAFAPWQQNLVTNDREVEAVLRSGTGELIDIAAAILDTEAYRDASWDWVIANNPGLDLRDRGSSGRPRVGVVANRLLDDIYSRLYGGLRVTESEHKAHVTDLMSCLGENRSGACRQLAKSLVENANFGQYNRDQFAALGR